MEPDTSFELLALHTSRAARTLKKESEIGALDPGKKADLVFCSATGLKFQPFLNQEGEERTLNVLLDELSGQDVLDVMIGGEFYVREKNILTYSEEDLIHEEKKLFSEAAVSYGEAARSVEDCRSYFRSRHPFCGLLQMQRTCHFEEGYRVIKKDIQNTETSAPQPEQPAKTQNELNKDVRHVFGDDE